MKKTNTLLASALMLAVLSGCTDATAKLKDSSTVLFSVGSVNVTKGTVYNMMKASSGASVAVNNATKFIAEKEVEVTEDMKKDAQSTLEAYIAYYGDSFTAYLEQNNMTKESYVTDYLIPSLQADELIKKYINEKFDELTARYKPVKATVLTFTAKEDAEAALSELKDGSKSPADAAKGHNSSSKGDSQIYTIETSLDAMVKSVLTSAKPEEGWIMTASSDSSEYAVLRVDKNDASTFKDEAVTTLSSITNVENDSTTFWFKKYGFHVYDKTIYDAVAADYPDNLVQDMKETPAETK
ncbi:MAG: hypothetical protein K6A40_02535 [Solobacterium sp.]|nr:hypothetical protein [Solobacterium sp.]